MRSTIFMILAVCCVVSGVITKKVDSNDVRCLVCKAGIQELVKKVSKIDPSIKVDIGGYSLDTDGNYKRKTVSQAKSEIHLSEVMEDICTAMDDYVRAIWKSNGTLTLLKLVTDEGFMNSDMAEVDVVQDDDLNKSLKYHCEGIMEELEEKIIKHFQQDSEDIHIKICTEDTSICDSKSKATPNINEEL